MRFRHPSRAARRGRSRVERGDPPMRYMFLIYSREGAFADVPAEDLQQLINAHWAVMDATREKGVLVAAAPLQPTATATTIRTEGGKPLVLDGPFAETKE